MSMADMILSKWDSDESYNQGPLEKADFFLNSIFSATDERTLGTQISIFSHFGIFYAFMSHQKGSMNLPSSDNGE